MIRQIWGMALNDLAVWLKSPSAMAAALLPALGMGALVAVLTSSVGRQPVALVVEDHGRMASRMARLIRADAEAYLLSDMQAAEAEKALGEEKIAAIIVIPENFDQAVGVEDGAVDLYLNNVDIDLADDIRRSVTRSVAEFDAPQLGMLGELHGPSAGVLLPNPYRVAVAERDLRETGVSFFAYQVIPAIILVVISVGVLGAGLLTARDFRRGTAKIMVLSPAPRSALVLGRLLGGTLVTLALTVPMVALSALAGPEVLSWNHALALGALLLAVTWMSVGLGTLLGIALRDERLMTMAGLNVAACLFFLGGGFTTVAFLPSWVQAIARFVPTRYAIDGLREALFYPGLATTRSDLAILTSCAAVSVMAASALLARSWKRA